MDFADYYWLGLLAAFLLLEIPAGIFRSRWTFSAHIWKWAGIGRNWRTDWAGLRWFILAGLLVSTSLHFLAGTSPVPIIVFGAGFAWSIVYHYKREAQ